MKLSVDIERWPTAHPFHITGHTWREVALVVVHLERDGVVGRGEGCGVYYRGETAEAMAAQIQAVFSGAGGALERSALQTLLGPGGARNALDCALWDLEAQIAERPVWRLAGLAGAGPLLTTCTLGADDPAVMAERAGGYAWARALKLKLTGEPVDAARVSAVREARPDVWLAVDANQGFTPESLQTLMPTLLDARVQLLEQPFRIGEDHLLEGLTLPIPVAADESVQDLDDVRRLAGCVEVINIKLDKCGGLTRGLEMARAARQLGLKVMVGNMLGTSLSMAPSFVLGQLCEVVDLDGPLMLAADRSPAVRYADGLIHCPDDLWGAPRTLIRSLSE